MDIETRQSGQSGISWVAHGRAHDRWRRQTVAFCLAAAVCGVVIGAVGHLLYQRQATADDMRGGAAFAELLRESGFELGRQERDLPQVCERTAEAIYGNDMFDLAADGWAPRRQKAFYVGCSGTAVGGVSVPGTDDGGGGGD